MNLAELVARAETIAVGRAVDPHDSPVIDSELTAEALVPHAFRYVARSYLREGRRSADVLRTYQIEMSEGKGVLPDSVLTEFWDYAFLSDFPYSSFLQYYPDFQRQKFSNLTQYACFENGYLYATCEGANALFIREIASVSKAAASDTLTAAAATGLFAALIDTGYCVVVEQDGEIVINATIQEVLTTDTVQLGTYYIGDIDTAVAVGSTCRIYRADLLDPRTFTASKLAASQNVTDDGTGIATDLEVGYLLSIKESGTETVRAVVVAVPDADTHTIDGFTAEAVTAGQATLSRRVNPLVTLRAAGVPDAPSTSSATINASQTFLEDVIALVADALTNKQVLTQIRS